MLKKKMMLFLLACYIWDVSAQEKHSEWSSFERKRQDKKAKINKEKHFRFGRFECSEFLLTDTEYAFVVGISGLSQEDFVVSTVHQGRRRFVHEKIIDVEKSESTEIDNYMCEQIVNINQLFFCGWGRLAGYDNPYELYDELLADPTILERFPNVYAYVFQKPTLRKYNLMRYQTMFRMCDNAPVSWGEKKMMCQVDRYLRSLNCLVYLQLDWGVYENRKKEDRGHALTMYGFTYDISFSKNKPERYTGVIVADSDNDKNVAKSTDAPNSLTIIPIQWDYVNKVYLISDRGKNGFIRFFYGLEGR